MAAQMLSPGVKVTIMDFTDYVSEASSTCIGIVGGARKGPTGATLIKSREQALLTFGEPSPKDFGIYSLLAVLENSTKVYYNRIISQDTKATAGNELKHKVLFQTKNYTSEYNGVRIKILKPDWNDEWLTGSLDPEHPEEFVGSDENIAKYGVDLSEVAQDTDETRRKQYFDIELSTTTGVLEEIKFCHLDTVVDRVAEESGIVEAFVNPDSSLSILYNTAMKLDGGSEFGASIAETEEHEGLKFFTKTYDSTVEGWYVEFSEETFMGTIDYTLYDVHGNVIEYFPDLVAFPNDDKYIETYINLNSDYVQCTLDSSLDDSNTVTRFQNLTFRFSGGLDGLDNINESDVVKALDAHVKLNPKEAPKISLSGEVFKGKLFARGEAAQDKNGNIKPQAIISLVNLDVPTLINTFPDLAKSIKQPSGKITARTKIYENLNVNSEITSDNPGDEITAVVAVAIGNELGCVVETTGINREKQELIDEAEFMVKYMMEKREVEINELIVKEATTTVECIASVVASVVYLEE